jgi:hypothetical protein
VLLAHWQLTHECCWLTVPTAFTVLMMCILDA